MKFLERIIFSIICRIDSKDGKYRRKFIKKKYDIEIGKYTYGYSISDIAKGTKIGAFCSIASGVKIGAMNHPTNFISTNPFLYYSSRGFIDKDIEISQKEPVVIEDDVWIGANSIVLPGVKIGKGAIIGAGAVVTKNVQPYAVLGGVPARVIKYRFNENLISKLIKIDWAKWDDKKIRENIELFYDPEKFIEKNERGII